jgi:tetratricopeptide (TPR) repeat protein
MKSKITCILAASLMMFLLAATTAPAASSGSDQTRPVSKKVQKIMKKADKRLKQNKMDKALALYQQAISLEKEYASPYYGIALIYTSRKKIKESLPFLEQAVKYNPNYAEAYTLLAKNLFTLAQQHEKAGEKEQTNYLYRKILQYPVIKNVKPLTYARALFQTGVQLSQKKAFDKANSHFRDILTIPEIELKDLRIYAMTHFNLGVNLTQMNQLKQAIRFLQKYITLQTENPTDPLLPVAHYALALNGYQLFEKKVEAIKKDKDKNKKERIAQLARTNRAIANHLIKAIEGRPNIEQAYLTLGNFYYLALELEDSLKVYQQLVEKFPNSVDLPAYQNFIQELKKEIKKSGK